MSLKGFVEMEQLEWFFESMLESDSWWVYLHVALFVILVLSIGFFGLLMALLWLTGIYIGINFALKEKHSS